MVAAVRVHKAGGPEVLTFEDVEIPAPGPGQIRVKQGAAGINFIDVYFRNGAYPPPNGYPFIAGNEGSGDVTAVGSGVTDIKVGDRIAAVFPFGGYAAERLVPADRAVKVPANISHQQAAGMMLKGLTAQYLVRRTHKVQKGDTVLMHAAAGGVGLILCQWAAHLGATVIGTVGTEEKAELAKAHGCAHPIVYSEQDFVAEVSRITNGEKLPVVYDSVGRDTFMRSLDCLKVRGLMVSFGNASGPVEPFSPLVLSQKGSLYLTRPTLVHYVTSREQLENSAKELFEVVAKGKVKIEVQQRFALKDAAEAHRALQARETTGSTILTI